MQILPLSEWGPGSNSWLVVNNILELNNKLSNPSFDPKKVHTLEFKNYFNQSLGRSLDSLVNLKDLRLGDSFNQPLEDSLKNLINLEKLTFRGYMTDLSIFNQPLKNSLDNLIKLKELTFSSEFNKPLENSLDNLINLESLTFYNFNQPFFSSLDNLINLRYLNLGNSFNQKFDNNLKKLNKLILIQTGYLFKESLDNLDDSLKNIIRFY